jgi:hypothetical protein
VPTTRVTASVEHIPNRSEYGSGRWTRQRLTDSWTVSRHHHVNHAHRHCDWTAAPHIRSVKPGATDERQPSGRRFLQANQQPDLRAKMLPYHREGSRTGPSLWRPLMPLLARCLTAATSKNAAPVFRALRLGLVQRTTGAR